MENSTDKKHKRRPRYKGTHPKKFSTKYKEHNPEKYQETIQKIIEKGNTPAGMHRSICVDEILDFFNISPGQIGLDATLGYGGHTLEMLKKIAFKGHLYALDRDPIELEKTKQRLTNLGYGSDVLTIQHLNFSDIDYLVLDTGLFDFVLADLGLSSMQIDNPERGFTFKSDGPLDLRMDPLKGISAAERLRELSKDEIEGMLIENADEPYAKEIANQIITSYSLGHMINTTKQFYEVIKNALSFLPKDNRDMLIKKSAQRSFQALRIDVNHEFESLYAFLEKLPTVLKPGGKVAILSFHSGEDRLVKKSFKYFKNAGEYKEISNGPIRPSMNEQISNSRSKSAKLRWAIKS
ncbi:16S rRNA (cytosine(1402)-N(4))-methyltransferase RsmH [Mycoplasmatota bacterium]|nr:16S rRNA (cytosine(1402)-N(4))-methyltransferase RsmH [Mycoplasmatota bacterium]